MIYQRRKKLGKGYTSARPPVVFSIERNVRTVSETEASDEASPLLSLFDARVWEQFFQDLCETLFLTQLVPFFLHLLVAYVMEHQYPQHEDLVQVMWLSLKTVSAPSFFRTV
ncbi:hypothetical protein HanXRQr2_Chr08g0334991 [Helianthus annuus]|uniref:Uncharacterized protein n=1 Tax=Helianthus annuus TaxID=4232 RepID=A0A9K3IEH3_HELAN|nr:hypothetical protein HanXRQr2_Chr08g0334991 [Helianthus annuus]